MVTRESQSYNSLFTEIMHKTDYARVKRQANATSRGPEHKTGENIHVDMPKIK